MKKQDVYKLLEEKMLGYADYFGVPVQALDEPLVPIVANPNLVVRQIDMAMLAHTGNDIYMRQSVLERLERAASLLVECNKTMQLEVVYGYRTLDIQKQLFEKYRLKLQSQYDGKELRAAVHRLIAVPEVAGHPAGAALDIQIIENGRPLDFGTKIWEFVPDSFVFTPFINKTAWSNRQLLRRIMMSVGFAPYDGEWWHFSYGDKEWAKYYGVQSALYAQLNFTK